MEKYEVRLVHEKDGWQIYQDYLPVMGKSFKHEDKIVAKSEARQLARNLLLDKFVIVDYCGSEDIIYIF